LLTARETGLSRAGDHPDLREIRGSAEIQFCAAAKITAQNASFDMEFTDDRRDGWIGTYSVFDIHYVSILNALLII
jgi:hypothetical protein